MKALYEIYVLYKHKPNTVNQWMLKYVVVEGVSTLGEATDIAKRLKAKNPAIQKIKLAYLDEIPVYTVTETDEPNLIRVVDNSQ